MNVLYLKEKGWQNVEFQKSYFTKPEDFASKMGQEIDHRLLELEELTPEEKKQFANIFQTFLANVLHYLIHYLPFDDKLINNLDFITLNFKPQELKEKILSFNKTFEIIAQDQVKDLCEEISALVSSNIDWARIKSQESTLYLWDIIECSSSKNEDGSSKYQLLSKILQTAHALPTSSACIEQSFSSLKLVKKAIRSNLHERTTQSLMLIAQEFLDKPIIITDKLLNKEYIKQEEVAQE